MTAELVPVDNMAVLEGMSADTREAAVTSMLTEARSWLAHAVEATEPQTIANFKAQMATVAEATKQLGLSKEIQLDAQEMVRRAERGVGVAIRKGQEEGIIAVRGQVRRYNTNGLDVVNTDIQFPTDFGETRQELSQEIYPLTDGVTDEQFEDAITEAKAEDNLSRANVVRKVNVTRSAVGERLGPDRLARIQELAHRGYTSNQIAKDLGLQERYFRERLGHGIDIPADKVMNRSHRGVNHDRILQQTISSLEGMVLALNMLDLNEVDLSNAHEWATSLNESVRALNRLNTKIKEMTQ